MTIASWMSQQRLAKLCAATRRRGLPDRLAHPRALRGYYATTLAEGVPILKIKARLGHGVIETTARYAELTHQSSVSLTSWTAATSTIARDFKCRSSRDATGAELARRRNSNDRRATPSRSLGPCPPALMRSSKCASACPA